MYRQTSANLIVKSISLVAIILVVTCSALKTASKCQDLDIRSKLNPRTNAQSNSLKCNQIEYLTRQINLPDSINGSDTSSEDVSDNYEADPSSAEDDIELDEVTRNAQLLSLFNGKLPDFLKKSLFDINGTALTNSDAPSTSLEKMDNVRTYLYNLEGFQGRSTLWEVGLSGMYAQVHGCEYSYMYMHRYENYAQLKQAAGPDVNQKTCISQLTDLRDRMKAELSLRYSSKDIRLHQLLDTFGRPPAGLLMGNIFWEGMYSECLRLKMDYTYEKDSSKLHGMRYCVLQGRHKSWPKDNIDREVVSIRAGICLPKSCDSLNYRNKYALIKELFESNMRQMDKDEIYLSNLYCLPDEDSPLRSIWHSKTTVLTLAAGAIWIGFLVYATLQYERAKRAAKIESSPKEVVDRAIAPEKSSTSAPSERGKSKMLQVFRALSIIENANSLFSTDVKSSLMEVGKEPKLESETSDDQQVEAGDKNDEKLEFVDLKALEGIKVISMCYVITGHVLMCVSSGLIDGRQIVNNPVFFLANMVPAFSVNSFFAITGILTSYLMFKQNKSMSFIKQPSKWVAFILFRYIRIMPMYLLAVMYSKFVAKYTSSGPIWDYGTSGLSQRRICEQESWLWTLLYGANFKKPLDHCIPGGWYLANDFQFFLVTPIFLMILQRSAKWGKRLLILTMSAGFLASMASILRSDVDDFIPIARFEPHGFKTYVTNLHYNYTRPYYRIPAYLCGLFVGYLMYEFEQRKLEYHRNLRMRKKTFGLGENESAIEKQPQEDIQEPDWPEAFKNSPPVILVLVSLLCGTPFIALQLNFNKTSARIMTSFITPFYHVIFAVYTSAYILLISTTKEKGLLKRVLSAPQWKPFSRLCLCAVLINVEVILYIVQGRVSLHPLTTQYLLSINLLSIIATYMAAIVVCLLFEAPLRATLNHLLRIALHRTKNSDKVQEQVLQEAAPMKKAN